MSSELKKRMILAKHMASIDVIRRMEARLVEIKAAHAEAIGNVNDDLAIANETIRELEGEQEEYAAQMESTLLDVKYWLQDGLVHHKLVSDPRAILRKIEDAIG